MPLYEQGVSETAMGKRIAPDPPVKASVMANTNSFSSTKSQPVMPLYEQDVSETAMGKRIAPDRPAKASVMANTNSFHSTSAIRLLSNF